MLLSAPPAKYEIYSGKSGSIQGEMKETKPSKKVITNSMSVSFVCQSKRDKRYPYPSGLHFSIGDKTQRRTVDTVAHTVRRIGIALKHMAEVGVSGSAAHLMFCAFRDVVLPFNDCRGFYRL